MVGRAISILSLSVLLVGCGKKNTEPTNSPDANGSTGTALPESDDAMADEPADGVEPEDAAADEDAAPSRKALLKLVLKRDGKKIEHPGQMVELGEETTILITQGSHTHEIDFAYDAVETGFDVNVTYRDNGKQVLQKSATTEGQQWIELKSGKTVLSLFLDPEAGRVDEVEVVGGDDPLGGV